MLCSLHDAVSLEDQGCPSVLVCTDVFLHTARAHAEQLGLPDLPVVAIPNPLSGLSEDEVKHRAQDALRPIVAALTGIAETPKS